MCKLVCEVGAIYFHTDVPEDQSVHIADNAAFFDETLSGRDVPLGSPGGAYAVGRVGVDTAYVASLPPRSSSQSAHV